MPEAIRSKPLSSFKHVEPTKEPLEWADLPTVDLSKINTPEGKKEQSEVLIKAVRDYGFFYVKGYAIDQDRVDNQLAIGQSFYELPLEEKLKYESPDLGKGGYNGYRPAGRRVLEKLKYESPDLGKGGYNGYRPAGRRVLEKKTGTTDRTEVYNIPKFGLDFPHTHPAPIASQIEEVEAFARDLHTHILDPLFDLTSIALELPENHLRDLHKYEEKSEDHLRYMKYTHYNEAETKAIGNLWSQGHTDLGTYTLLARQPVCALQIKLPSTGEWKWVKPEDGTFTVNACDALSFLTGGYISSTIHRVSAPPKDQSQLDRLGLLYFARPKNTLTLHTVPSPLLQREGFSKNGFEAGGHNVPTMEEWVKAKQTWQQEKGTYRHEGQILPGFNERYYD